MNQYIKKPLPDPRKYSLIPPDMDYIYFEKCKLFPFDPHNTKLSLTNAWWLAESSFLVYNHPGFARMAFKLAGLDNFKFFQGTGTECMVTWNKESLIIAFRGTELNSLSTFHEIRTDLNTIPTEFELGGKVHKGFLNALDEIWNGKDGLYNFLQERMKDDTKRAIWVTGHSLGGALAGLCFTRLPSATGLFMFGAPKIGDKDFINLTKDRAIWRVENNKDPIPMVPPNMPTLKFNFEDMGQLIFMDQNQQLFFQRPELAATEHLELVKSKIQEQREIRKILAKKVIKGEKVYIEINAHLKNSIEEWKEYVKQLGDDTKFTVTDHVPIFYCTILWNNLISE